MMSPEALLTRYKTASAISEQWRDMLDDAYEFAIPQRNTFYQRTVGERKATRVFDSTAERAVITFANRLHSDLTPPFQKWAKLAPGPMLGEDQEEQAEKILDKANETLFALIQQSNFDSAINEFYIDLAIGTACLLIQPGGKRQPLSFQCVPIAEVSLEEGPNGTIHAVFRKHKVRARLITATWTDAKIPTEINRLMTEEASKDHEVKLVECTYYDMETDQWMYEVIDPDSKTCMVKRASRTSPFVVARWTKTPGEVFGRGPVIYNLNDIKTTNKLTELELKNGTLAVTGAYMVANDAGVNPNTLRVVPGAFIAVNRTAGPNGPSIAPLPRTGDFQVVEVLRERLLTGIKRALFDEQLPPQSGSVRSATEIMERVKELSQATTGPFGRLMSELINPFMARSLEVIDEQGYLDESFDVDGLMVSTMVQSPLAQQQSMDDVQKVVRWMELLNSLVGQEGAMLGASMEDIPEYLAEKIGVPEKLKRDKDAREKIQGAVAKMLAGMMAQRQQAGGAAAPTEQSEGEPPQQ